MTVPSPCKRGGFRSSGFVTLAYKISYIVYTMKPQPESKDAVSIVAQPKKSRDEGSASLPPIEKSAKRTDVDRSASLPISAVRAKKANKKFTVASYNVRTLNDTVCHDVTISDKIQQLINCFKQTIFTRIYLRNRIKKLKMSLELR